MALERDPCIIDYGILWATVYCGYDSVVHDRDSNYPIAGDS